MNERIFRLLAFGVAAAAVAVILAPSVARAAQPAVRTGMKLGFLAYARGREAAAEFIEMVEDAYAEATAELKQEADALAAGAGATAAEAAPSSGNGKAGAERGAGTERKRKRRR
jgi:hypothetical protein